MQVREDVASRQEGVTDTATLRDTAGKSEDAFEGCLHLLAKRGYKEGPRRAVANRTQPFCIGTHATSQLQKDTFQAK